MNLFNISVNVAEEPEYEEIEVRHHHNNKDTCLFHMVEGHTREELKEDGEYLAGHEQDGVDEVYWDF